MYITSVSLNTIKPSGCSSRNKTPHPAESDNACSISPSYSAYPPAVVGIVNGLCWGTVGYAFDKGCAKLFGYKSNNKTSLAVNGIIGTGMGIYSYIQTKKIQR